MLDDMIEMVFWGAERRDGDLWIGSQQYRVKCYREGTMIRIDLEPKKKMKPVREKKAG